MNLIVKCITNTEITLLVAQSLMFAPECDPLIRGLFGLVLVVLWCLWDQLLMLYTDRGRGWFQIPPEMFNGRVSVWLRLNRLVIIWPCLDLWGLVWVDLNR